MYRVFCGNARIDVIGFEKWKPPSPPPTAVSVPATNGTAPTPALAVLCRYDGPPWDLRAVTRRFSLGLSPLQSPVVLRRTEAVLEYDSTNSPSDVAAAFVEREGRQEATVFKTKRPLV
jgi:hypothetical protein